MNRKKLIGGIAGTLLVIGLWIWTSQLDSSSENSVETEDFLKESHEQVAALYQAPREDGLEAPRGVTKECQDFFRALRGLDLTRHQEKFPNLKSLVSGEACKQVPSALQKLQEHFEKVCKDTQNANQCLVALYYYRLYRDWETDRKSTRLNSSHLKLSRMPSSA